MNSSKMKKAFVLALVISSSLLGCELIVDFDRTRIPVEGTPEASTGDGSTETDTGAPDTGADAEEDADVDAGPDAGSDDASADADADADA